jgi:hypothetical protein
MTDNNNVSIHPRHWPIMVDREKQNTCRRKSAATVQRKIAGLRRHAEQHPRCAVTQAHLAKALSQLSAL